MAESYEDFQEVLENRSLAEQTVIIERMIKVNHPSLGNDNRSNLQRLFLYLLQHLNDNSCSIVSVFFITWAQLFFRICMLFCMLPNHCISS